MDAGNGRAGFSRFDRLILAGIMAGVVAHGVLALGGAYALFRDRGSGEPGGEVFWKMPKARPAGDKILATDR